jgi:hypothetical protein
VVQFPHVAVLFYERESEDSEAVLEALVKQIKVKGIFTNKSSLESNHLF